MPVIYNGSKLIPGPYCQILKSYQTTEDGRKLGSLFNISLNGTILPDRGSPNSTGTFWTASSYPPNETVAADSQLTSILRKQEAIRDLFSDEGKTLEIQGYDGMQSLKANPRVKSIEFPAGNPTSWASKCNYTIVLEADIVTVNGVALGEDNFNDYIDKFDEAFNLETSDDIGRTFRLTHQISAKGKRFYDETGALGYQPWQYASGYVMARLGIDNGLTVGTGIIVEAGLEAYNYFRSSNVNETAGTFSVSESWLCYSPGSGAHAIEEFNVNSRKSEEGRTSVTVEGTIRGLEVRNNTTRALTSTRWTNAKLKFSEIETTLAERASTISGYTLHNLPINRTVGRNQNNGVITYNYEYNDRPSSVVPGAISEIINIGYENQADVFASIPILGRAAGPVLQDIGTKTARRKSLSIEYIVNCENASGLVVTEPSTDSIVNSYIPSANSVFKDRDTQNFSPTSGRGNRQISWTFGN